MKNDRFFYTSTCFFKPDERQIIENMRTNYFHQLQKQLEPERISMQSKTANGNAASGSTGRSNGVTKIKQEMFRNQRPQDSLGSFDCSAFN